jgi:hypothetical protein
MSKRVECVEWRERDGTTGWCAVAWRDPREVSTMTKCQMFVSLPGNFERRKPTCPECIAALARSR